MAATIILVRHCAHDWLRRVLVGRRTDVPLNAAGAQQSERIADRLARCGVTHILSSPRFRALQSARPLSCRLGKPIEINREFDEIDFGEWSGRPFDELKNDPRWQRWNSQRATCRPPGGESMHQVQSRVLRGLERAAESHRNGCVAIFTHAEPIRAAVLHFRGIALDAFYRVEVDPGTLTTLAYDNGGCMLLRENEHVDAIMVAA